MSLNRRVNFSTGFLSEESAAYMICTVVGARPNFIKMAPIIMELSRRGLPQVFVHTGQHYDARMSAVFFDELGLPQPDVYLGVGSGTHAEQTARVMLGFEQTCFQYQPRLVIVAGDVNSTLACALSAAKLNIPVAHVEAGLRSNDRTMPEEINRIVTDHLADLLFTTEPSGSEHLRQEGIAAEKIHFVGNSMIDTLRQHVDRAAARRPWEAFGVQPDAYGLVTLHRPSNIDDPATAREIAEALREISVSLPLIFPIHPRTLSKNRELWNATSSLRIVEPLGYLDFLGLMSHSKIVITDSGGIQEETTALGIPCLTLRYNTERPVTITDGTNRLVAPRKDAVLRAFHAPVKHPDRTPELWDGCAAPRIVDVIETVLPSLSNH